jgi:hypothetical protein
LTVLTPVPVIALSNSKTPDLSPVAGLSACDVLLQEALTLTTHQPQQHAAPTHWHHVTTHAGASKHGATTTELSAFNAGDITVN